jgi:hypothetical protein
VDETLAAVLRLSDRPAAPRSVPRREPEEQDPEATRLAMLIQAKRRAIADLEGFRRRRLSELQARLAEKRAVFADSHPDIVTLEESIRVLQEDSPQLLGQRQEEAELLAEYERRGGRPLTDGGRAASPEPLTVFTGPASKTDARGNHARQQLEVAKSRYNALTRRIENARMEMDAARAAFKYRYTITLPAKLPTKPTQPLGILLPTAGLLAGCALAPFLALFLQVRRGLIVQPWQISRRLGLPILAEARMPSTAMASTPSGDGPSNGLTASK